MEITEIDYRVAPVYSRLMEEATRQYLYEGTGARRAEGDEGPPLWQTSIPDTSLLNPQEFLDLTLESGRQPMNPVTVAREALAMQYGDEYKEATERQVALGLRRAFVELRKSYKDNGVDSSPLALVFDLINHTEAFITGYSRQIDRIAGRLSLALAADKHTEPVEDNSLFRWNSGLWVPDEDMHDRTLNYVLQSTRLLNIEKYNKDHIRHMKIGNRVKLNDFIGSNAFVTLQEDATVISYKNAAKVYGPVFGYILGKTGNNEAQHTRAYGYVHMGLARDFSDETVLATAETIEDFDMPGKDGIRGYDEKARLLGYLGILDPEALLKSQKRLISRMAGLDFVLKSDEAKIEWEKLLTGKNKGMRRLSIAARFVEKAREIEVNRPVTKQHLRPIVLGQTVEAHPVTHKINFLTAA